MNLIAKLFNVKKPEWLNRHVILLMVTLIIFVLTMIWSEPIPQAAAMQMKAHASPQDLVLISDTAHSNNVSRQLEPQNSNFSQTNGVISGAVILLLIILSGVITGLQLSRIKPNQN